MKTFVNALEKFSIATHHSDAKSLGESSTIYVQRVIGSYNDWIKTEKSFLTGIGPKVTGKPTNFRGINVFSCVKKQLSLIFHEKLNVLP